VRRGVGAFKSRPELALRSSVLTVVHQHDRGHSGHSGMLDVVGFDTATPQLIAGFARGTL
jgi:hypothetical protein